jgi:hypothetical protein
MSEIDDYDAVSWLRGWLRIQIRGLASAQIAHLEGREDDAWGLLGAILEEFEIDEMEDDFADPSDGESDR